MNDNITKKINHELNESIKTDFSIKLMTSSAFNMRNANSNIFGANYILCFYHEKGIQEISISSIVKFRMETDRNIEHWQMQ